LKEMVLLSSHPAIRQGVSGAFPLKRQPENDAGFAKKRNKSNVFVFFCKKNVFFPNP